MLIDSHCHLDYFSEEEIPKILTRARNAGVGLVQTISTKISQFEKILNIVNTYEEVCASVGIHPNDAATETITVDKLVKLTQHEKVISIGETGLDYHYEMSPRSVQKKLFIIHIEAARITGLPLIIHARDADEDMMQILQKEYNKGKFKAVMHSFTSSKKLCDVALELGFYISFSGIVTFNNAKEVQALVSNIPVDKILVETDSPYLAPIPYRGKKNEPAFVVQVNNKIQELTNNNVNTTDNFQKAFDLSITDLVKLY